MAMVVGVGYWLLEHIWWQWCRGRVLVAGAFFGGSSCMARDDPKMFRVRLLLGGQQL